MILKYSEHKNNMWFITTCMGRLDHLKMTIGSITNRPGCKYTLVDYSCPQKCGQWAKSKYKNANVVYVENKKLFHLAEARNIGFRSITASNRWVCFVDCDVIITDEFFSYGFNAPESNFYLSDFINEPGHSGIMIVSYDNFIKAGGYDENYRDYGTEDDDLKLSLMKAGVNRRYFPRSLIRHIEHDDALRVANYICKNKHSSMRRNEEYCRNKFHDI